MTAGLLLGDALLPRSKAASRRHTACTQASQLRVRAAQAAGQQQGAGAKQPAAAGKELLRSSKAGNSAQSNAARPAGRTTTVLGLPATLPPPLQRVDTRAAAAALGGVVLLALLLARPWLSRGCVLALAPGALRVSAAGAARRVQRALRWSVRALFAIEPCT